MPEGASGEDSSAIDDMAARVSRLTAGQLDCLRLVDQHLSSKEIAAELQISRTRSISVFARHLPSLAWSAAPMPARIVSQHAEPYQRLIHQSPYSDRVTNPAQPDAAARKQIRHTGRAGGVGGPGFNTEQRPASFRPFLQPPFATRSNPRNEMSVGQRLFWIAAIAIGAAFSAGMYLAGLESLARLLNS